MHLCLFEDRGVLHLNPMARTRGVYQIRTGAFNNMLRLWELFERPAMSLHARSDLAPWIRIQTDLPVNELPVQKAVLFLNGRISLLPAELLVTLKQVAGQTSRPAKGRVFMQGDTVIAAWAPQPDAGMVQVDFLGRAAFDGMHEEQVDGVELVDRLWQMIDGLQTCLEQDLVLLQNHESRKGLHSTYDGATLVNADAIHVAPGAFIHPGAIVNASEGPVFIDKDAQVMESAIVKGPVYLGQKCVVKPRADIGCTALGPVCKAGGEVKEVIMQSFSNKAHEGFLGHAYMGSWCNIGAGTNASNLRNDYIETTLYNEVLNDYEKTGRQFLGLFMADHSKLGISSMVNTATVFGVSCNLFGSGFMPRYLPSFTWGGPDTGYKPYRLERAFESMKRIMARRGRSLSEEAMKSMESLHNLHHDHSEVVA